MAGSTLSWQPELQLVQALMASATALEQVLLSATPSTCNVSAGPSGAMLEVNISRIVKGACSALQSVSTVACRSVFQKVKTTQRPMPVGTRVNNALRNPNLQTGGDVGSGAHEIGSGVESPLVSSAANESDRLVANLAP